MPDGRTGDELKRRSLWVPGSDELDVQLAFDAYLGVKLVRVSDKQMTCFFPTGYKKSEYGQYTDAILELRDEVARYLKREDVLDLRVEDEVQEDIGTWVVAVHCLVADGSKDYRAVLTAIESPGAGHNEAMEHNKKIIREWIRGAGDHDGVD
jgi:hypothetical protein